MGGQYVEGNVISVEVTSCDKQTANHTMWHFANWQLWGKAEDRLAWQGLAGFLNKEEVVEELMEEGRRKGRITNRETTKRLVSEGNFVLQDPKVRQKALENSQKTQQKLTAEGLHQFQNAEFRARRAEEDRVKRIREFELGVSPLLKPEVIEKRKVASSKSRSNNNSKVVECPHCGKQGGATNMSRYHFKNCKSSP